MDEPPLQSPDDQQADDALRGFEFQCWLSVEAWLELKEEERLFIECAEDFAIFSPAGARLVQPKALAANVTLRSESVVKTIGHLWGYWQQTPSVPFQLSFLTTAEIGRENDNPFDGRGGLAVWNEAAIMRDPVAADALRRFLLSDPSVSARLPEWREFLQQATPAQVLEKLIVPLKWDTGREEVAGVISSVLAKLTALIDRHYATGTAQASALADVLFAQVVRRGATKEKTPLTRAHWLQAADRHFGPQMAAAVAIRRSMLTGLVAGATGAPTDWTLAGAAAPLQPADDYSRRELLTTRLQEGNAGKLFLVFAGSSGMGKTTLAQLYCFKVGGFWLQVRAGERAPERVQAFQECFRLLDGPTPANLIVDDLCWEDLDAGALNILRGMAFKARQRRVRLVFTSPRVPTLRRLAEANLSDTTAINVAALTPEEITEVATRLGCPEASAATAWGVLLRPYTTGHPQLVHAILTGLRERQWPPPSLATLGIAQKLLREEKDRAQLLLQHLPAGAAELLARFSLFLAPFRRDQALALAQRTEPVPNAAPLFERLRGPWIEPVRQDYFRVSPLVASASESGVPPERIRQWHAGIVQAVLLTPPVYATDVTSVLLNAVAAGAADDARGMIARILAGPSDSHRTMLQLLAWTLAWKDGGKPAFPQQAEAEVLFRLLQVEVAAEVDPKSMAKFYVRADAAIGALADPSRAEFFRGLLAFQAFKSDGPALPIGTVLRGFPYLLRLGAEFNQQVAASRPAKMALPAAVKYRGADEEFETGLAMSFLSHRRGRKFVEQLLEALEGLTESERTVALRAMSRGRPQVFLLLDRIWLAEEKKEKPNWNSLVALFERVHRAALSWGAEVFAIAAVRAIAVVRSEYLNDSAGALALLATVETQDPEMLSVVSEQRGKIHLFERKFPEAQGYFEAAIDHHDWSDFNHLGKIFCLQSAGTAAGFAGDWPAAARHFGTGAELAQREKLPVRAAGLLADAGFALWQTGDKPAALARFADVAERAGGLPNPTVDLEVLRVLKAYGNMLLRLAWGDSGRTDQSTSAPVTPGMCSDPRLLPALRKLPPPFIPFYHFFVCWLEFEHTTNLDLWHQWQPYLSNLPYPGMRYFTHELVMRHQLRDGQWVAILATTVTMTEDMALMRAHPNLSPQVFRYADAVNPPWTVELENIFPVPQPLLCALTLALIRGHRLDPIFAECRTLAMPASLRPGLHAWLDEAAAILQEDIVAAYQHVRTHDNRWFRWVAALRLMLEPKLPPEALLTVSICLVLASWKDGKMKWVDDTAREIDYFLSARWIRVCDEQRFAFTAPDRHLPDLRQCATAPDGTAAHLAKLALLAIPALTLGVPQGIIDELTKSAAGRPVPGIS